MPGCNAASFPATIRAAGSAAGWGREKGCVTTLVRDRSATSEATCRRFAVLAALLLVAVFAASSHARASDITAPERQFVYWESQIDTVEDRIARGVVGPVAVERMRDLVDQIIIEAGKAKRTSAERVAQVESLLSALGPKPEDGEESEAVRAKREELQADLTQHQGQMQRAGLVITRAEQLLGKITTVTRERLKERLLKRGVSPLTIEAWAVGAQAFAERAIASYVEAPAEWFVRLSTDEERGDAALRILAISLVITAAGLPVRRWLLGRYGRSRREPEPGYARRLLAAVVEATGRGLIPVLFIVAVAVMIRHEALLGYQLGTVMDAVVRYLVIFLFSYALIDATFTPDHPVWRVTPLDDAASRLIVRRLKALLLIFTVFGAVQRSFAWSTPSPELESVFALAFMAALYPAIVALLQNRVWTTEAVPDAEGVLYYPHAWSKLRFLLGIVFAALPVSAAAGYPKLATFLAQASVLTGIVLGALWILRWLLRETVTGLLGGERRVSRRIREFLALKDEGAARLTFWIGLLVDLVLLFTAGVLLLPLWGFGVQETANWLTRLFRGVQVGSYTFSLLDVVLAIALFALVMLITRLVQRGLERHLLPNVVRDRGVRDALRTGVGYVGAIIAALIGISTLGLDLSNLAIIAGALSVGIGFGLQNVVNNFVSGLILLIERPIKQGDWVIVGGYEGTVKNVNVRSTEIETFQQASVIMPNADLIANPVTNWTHKNHRGRIEVGVGVAYGSDVDLVRDTLEEIGRAHPDVASYPEPYVYFKNFGDSTLDFELRCYLIDIETFLRTSSDLRYAICKTFRERGIEIAFPQRVVHFADAPSSAAGVRDTPPVGSGDSPPPVELPPGTGGRSRDGDD